MIGANGFSLRIAREVLQPILFSKQSLFERLEQRRPWQGEGSTIVDLTLLIIV